ncbi:caspase family protein [Parasphingorhabdus cellanae]|uniref:Caspase family protein n=1 Tax=Parasphingorhabdus cellanae TaxID=2806553 RepID=A0ABX7T4A2_9SPHN|nr:caspase family protein [Parasphingorhabdus cellanae]QTD55080.1 caspase family protein [Parasphingorhabdus cellanae]
MNLVVRLLTIIIVIFAIASNPSNAKRVALVIANSDYQNASSLANPASDARLIAASLKQSGFDNVDVKYDLSKSALESELRDFGQRSDGADVSLVYYAGHGIEAGGQNYLIPVDAELQRDRDLEIEATRLETALLMVEGGRLKIVILDACRNNPFISSMQRTMRNRSVGRGLAPIEPEGETLVVYAAKAGATAADGDGANSPFAEALARRLVQPGLEISLLFRSVRDDVLRKTGRQQEPFTYGSLSGNAFYFVPGKNQTAVSNAASALAPSVSAETGEALFWQGAVSANSEKAYRSYLKQYPQGRYAGLAEENIARINALPASVPGVQGFTIPSFSNVIGPGAVGSGSNINAATIREFDFKASAAVRRKTSDTFIKQLQTSDPASAQVFGLLLASQDLFALVQREAFDKYGMRTNNMADTFSLLIGVLHDAANGVVTEATTAQAQGLRNQMAKLLILTPEQIPQTDAGKQELSDLMLLNSLVLATSLDAAKNNPTLMKQISDRVSNMTKTQMGVDLKAMVLTDNGFQPRSQ